MQDLYCKGCISCSYPCGRVAQRLKKEQKAPPIVESEIQDNTNTTIIQIDLHSAEYRVTIIYENEV